MWKKARELFAGKNALDTARASGALPEVFVSMDITFLCLPEAFREGLPATATQEEVVAFVEKAAADLAARESFEPFVYAGSDGARILPIFTESSHAETFTRSVRERSEANPAVPDSFGCRLVAGAQDAQQ